MRLRRHGRQLGAFALAIVLLVALFGNREVVPLVSASGTAARSGEGISITGLTDLFDRSFVHTVTVDYDPDEYAAAVDAYLADTTKDYLAATVTVDGTRLDEVGLRLKGNSTLDHAMHQQPADRYAEWTEPVPGIQQRIDLAPLLLRFDWYVDGQRYQDVDELALRLPVYGVAGFNESVALDLVAAAGLPSERSVYANVSFNGEPAQLRLLVEVPTGGFAERNFDGDGVLYRATGVGTFDDVGDDPALYEVSFEQITRKRHADLTPVVDLIHWTATATDAEFAAGLDDRVDVAALADYLAVHRVLNNWDDMGGGGNNYYLWYDQRAERFTVVTWDVNLAFYRTLFREQRRAEQAAQPAPNPTVGSDGVLQVTLEPEVFGDLESDNELKNRFLREPAFAQRYFDAVRRHCTDLLSSGLAERDLDDLVATLVGGAAVDPVEIYAEAQTMREALALAGDQCRDPAWVEDLSTAGVDPGGG